VPDAGSARGLLPLLAVYLGSRADLLPLPDCAALLTTPCVAPQLPVDTVAQILREHLGLGARELVESLEPAAAEADLFFQVHRARTEKGEPVLVKVLRPDARERAGIGLAALRADIGRSPVEQDFRRFVHARLNLSDEAAALGILADDGRDLGIMVPPRVLGRFCAPGVLVTEDCRLPFAAGPVPEADGYSSWIRQAVMGRVFPQEPLPIFRRLQAAGPVAIRGGPLAQTTERSRRNIARYLLAVSADDPERAADALLAESDPKRGARSDEEVRQRFRFCVPERDSPLEWLDRPSTVSHCITHWRFLSRAGWEPGPVLLAFLRGLTVLTVRNELNTGRDLLLECLDEIRPHLLVFRARKIIDGLQAGANPGGIVALGRRFAERSPLGLSAVADRTSSLFAFGSRLLLLAAAGILAPSLVAGMGRHGDALAAGAVFVAGVSTLAAACRPWTADRERVRRFAQRKHVGDSEDVIG
jgi:hypothetical protein